MDISLLAVASNSTGALTTQPVTNEIFWQHITKFGIREALMLIAFGIVCIFYGWRIFKGLVVLCCAFIGMAIGMMVDGKLHSSPWMAVLGLLLMGFIAFPFTKYAVCILGAFAGGVLTGGIWYAFGLPYEYIWAGALVGVVAGAMISFIVFKISVMLFTCLAGSVMVIAGLLAVFRLYQPSSQMTADLVLLHKWFLPALLIFFTIVCMFVQNKLIKEGASFSLESE
jgi:hypothetical protein